MFIIFLELLLLVYFVLKRPKEERAGRITVLTIIFLWLIIWLIVLQSELIQDGTYGSDARYYYQAMIYACQSEDPLSRAMEFLAPGYVFLGTIILLTSPTDSVIWVKISNVLIFLLSINFLYTLMISRGGTTKTVIFASLCIGLNGIIDWMVLRNLKETLFVFLVISQICLLRNISTKQNKLLIWVGWVSITLIFIYLLQLIRPFGAAFAVIISFVNLFLIIMEIQNKRATLLLFSLCLPFILYIVSEKMREWWGYWESYRELFGLGSDLVNIKYLPLYLGNFLTGPGPIRSYFQISDNNIFVVSSYVGDILIFLGSIMWWLILSYLCALFMFASKKSFFKVMDIFSVLIVIILLYSITYGGSSDTRQKAMTYIFLISLMPIMKNNIPRNKSMIPITMLINGFIWSIGSVVSILTL